tara:strand:- start:1986 stop:2462 length:477 start_codon:yes stop_codon:yes gene_type:complete
MSPITSINLDEETKQIAKRVGNFSGFVRDCLRRWNAYDLGEHLQPERADIELGKKCFPEHKRGCCVLCWPDGSPRKEDWTYYCETGGKVVVGKRIDGSPIFEMRNYNNAWIEEKAREANIVKQFPIPQQKTFKHSRRSRSTPRLRGRFRAIVKALLRQ